MLQYLLIFKSVRRNCSLMNNIWLIFDKSNYVNALYGWRGYYVMRVYFPTKEDVHEMKHNYDVKVI